MYILKIYEELKTWIRIRSVVKEFEPILNENGFRVDWIGRVYTIINLPEEVVNQYTSIQGYILMRLRDYDELFLKIGIAGEVYPELVQKTESAWLLVLSAEREYLRVLPVIWSIIQISFIVFILKICYNLIEKHTGFFTELMNLI